MLDDGREYDAHEEEAGSIDDPDGCFDQQQIGPYRILQKVGEGGMGVVYVAEQREPVRRRVALKVIKPGMDTKAVLARFDVEHHALTIMNHPGIARVFDAGATPDGRPYFAMEYVPGAPITDFCDGERLSTRERLDLFSMTCSAVQHAHQKGIIHRDLKPSNVLVTMQDGEPLPKIIDFGVAKATAQRLTQQTLHTEIGQIIGTPEYMSPEQAEMTGVDIDTRSDVYSLGVILYELLVGSLPFEPSTLRTAGYAEIQRIIREVDPAKPSTRLSQHGGDTELAAARRRSDTRTLTRRLRGDLDWITMKALEKNRARRYGSASELAADIARHLAHEPVTAGPPGVTYRFKKFFRKNRVLVTTAALVFLALVAGMVTTWTQYRRAEREKFIANRERNKALALAVELRTQLDLRRLAAARVAADRIWPAHPAQVVAMKTWLEEQAAPLRENLPEHVATLESLRKQGMPLSPREGEEERATWKFSSEEDQWKHDTLAALVADLEAFVAADPKVGTIASVERRLEFASSIEERSVSGVRAASAWREAISDIGRLEVYRDLTLEPQLGLLPLRRDPHSGLWEFWHIQTGAKPEPNPDPDATNPWLISGDSGLVFVLIPGGTFTMGAQNQDPKLPNHDPQAKDFESPPHPVTLAPFFVSRYELTQGQWERFVGKNPSQLGPNNKRGGKQRNLAHPVEYVSWHDCQRVLSSLGLRFLTEAQWEYAARAGSETVWWTGSHMESLRGAANLGGAGAPGSRPEFEDGYLSHAPVGTFLPNPYGLHDVHGNVHEWCRDGSSAYSVTPRPEDGERGDRGTRYRIHRGGSFMGAAVRARSANRPVNTPDFRYANLGVRPARAIQ